MKVADISSLYVCLLPEITKNTSTPINPPASHEMSAWNNKTSKTAKPGANTYHESASIKLNCL
jgi:hypothetical protein